MEKREGLRNVSLWDEERSFGSIAINNMYTLTRCRRSPRNLLHHLYRGCWHLVAWCASAAAEIIRLNDAGRYSPFEVLTHSVLAPKLYTR